MNSSTADADGHDGVSLAWRPGDVVLGIYEVLAAAEDGVTRTCRVRHRGWGIDLAVWVPSPAVLASDAKRRDAEAAAEAWLALGPHPHTVSCEFVRRLGGAPCVFAEWVDGASLANQMRDRRLYAGGLRESLQRILDVAIRSAGMGSRTGC